MREIHGKQSGAAFFYFPQVKDCIAGLGLETFGEFDDVTSSKSRKT